MTITDAQKTIGALAATAALAVAGFSYFQPRAEAAEQKKAMAEQQSKDVQDVRAAIKASERRQQLDNLRLKIQLLNSKAKLTADDKNELEFSRELVKKLQLEALQ